MKKSIAVAALPLMLLASICDSSVAGTGTGTIQIRGATRNRAGGTLFFFSTPSVNTTNAPLCNTTKMWVVDTSTPAGLAVKEAVFDASNSRKNVTVTGNGACDTSPHSETAQTIKITN